MKWKFAHTKCRDFPAEHLDKESRVRRALSPTKEKQLDARRSVVGSLPNEFLSEAC